MLKVLLCSVDTPKYRCTYPLAEYRHIEADRWQEVSLHASFNPAKLHQVSAELLICPDNTVHQALDLIRDASPLPWLHIAEEVRKVAVKSAGFAAAHSWDKVSDGGPTYQEASIRAASGGDFAGQQAPRIDTFIFEELVWPAERGSHDQSSEDHR